MGDRHDARPRQLDHLAWPSEVSASVVAAFVRLLPVDGGAVLLMIDRTRWRTATATDAAVTALEDLQLTAGEGPSIEAYVTGGPVLLPDLAAAATRWPAFVSEAPDAVSAFFSFPLQVGAVRFGVLDLYRRTSGRLDGPALTDALRLADLTAAALVHHPTVTLLGGTDGPPIPGDGGAPEVDQATGMTSVHLGVNIVTAYARLRGFAYAGGRPLTDVARAVVAGVLRLDEEDRRGPPER